MSIRVTNVQRMCFDDGPGIRTTVFLKGCSLHCPWCSNPENIQFEKQKYFCQKQKKSGVYGNDYELEELLEELLKDRIYWGTDGGVTFSGGEALLWAEELEPLWKRLKKEKIHLTVETALFVSEKQVQIAAKYIDYFYVDVKILDQEMGRDILGGDTEQYLNNVQVLAERKANIHFRVPCSMEYVLSATNRKLLFHFFKIYNSYPVELFGIHDLGRTKYEALGQKMPKFQKVPMEALERFKTALIQNGSKAVIITV